MVDDRKKGSFDKLVAGLSSEDRTVMLNRINQNLSPSVQFVETETAVDNNNTKLSLRIKQETFVYRFFIWLRSIFRKTSVENIYNEDIIASLARKVDRNHPNLLNHHAGVLDSIFYERLKSLKEAADFFKPYFSFINDAIGDFYVFLSSIVTPQLSEDINSTADPFILPFSKVPSSEVKKELVIKLDAILKNMDSKSRGILYSSISATNWLNQFTHLPYLHFLAQFTNITGSSYTCPYSNALNDYEMFAKVFTNVIPVSNEVLEAVYLFSQRKNLTDNAQEKDIDRAVKEFIAKTNTHFATIQMFISGVPISAIGKIINNKTDWQSENIEGVEAWFPSFRNQWHKIIDIRWDDWQRERKKAMLSNNLMEDFELDSFPSLKFKPWEQLWIRVPFSCELTGGFLSWFASEQYPKVISNLNTVMMEGVFLKSENRTEYSEALSDFTTANTMMLDLLGRLSPEGEYGSLFEEFAATKVRSFQIQNQIDSMMTTTESEIREIIKKMGKGCRGIEFVFHGFFDEEKDGIHESLQNFTTIKGHQNRQFRESLMEIRRILKQAMFYIQELEPIDNATEK